LARFEGWGGPRGDERAVRHRAAPGNVAQRRARPQPRLPGPESNDFPELRDAAPAAAFACSAGRRQRRAFRHLSDGVILCPVTMGDASKAFFISHAGADVAWARWLDWELRAAGYGTVVQCYDFRPGNNFVLEIERALGQAERVLAVLSPAYLRSGFAGAEWAAAFAEDPSGAKAKLVPVRVADFTPEGLFRALIHIDLFGKNDSDARAALLDGLRREATRPETAPRYPGVPEASTAAAPQGEKPPFAGALPAIWALQRARNPHFTGRDAILDRIHDGLRSGKRAALTQAVRGLGGVGKSELALEYAHRFASDYDGVAWLRAEDTSSLGLDYAALAEPLGLEQSRELAKTVAAVRAALSARGPFLLIFDNAGDPAALEPFLPHGDGRHILVTTRALSFAGAQTTRIDTLTIEEAVTFLLERTQQNDEASARHVAALLGELPLALEQAAAYIEASAVTLADYARLLEAHGLDLVERGKDYRYAKTIGTTWTLAIEALRECPGAAELLNLCAFLAPEAIHLGDLAEACRRAPGDGAAAAPPVPEPLAGALAGELRLHNIVRSRGVTTGCNHRFAGVLILALVNPGGSP
jgi:hypothetical protein